MTQQRAVASFFAPLGVAGLVIIAAIVIATVRSQDPVDTFYVLHAELMSPDYQASGPVNAGTMIDPTEKKFFAVNTHRVKPGEGTVIGWRWYSNGDISSSADEKYKKLTIWMPTDLPSEATVDLTDPYQATAVYTSGGSAWPQTACWGHVSPGTLHIEHTGKGVQVQIKGTLDLSGSQDGGACESEPVDLTFIAQPLQVRDLSPWLGAPSGRPYDETYRKSKL